MSKLAAELVALCDRHGLRLSRAESCQAEFSAEQPQLPESGVDYRAVVAAFENSLIAQALTHARGNRAMAARLLRLNRTTLVEKIKMKLDTDADFRARYVALDDRCHGSDGATRYSAAELNS